MNAAVERQIRDRIRTQGRVTFAEFMHTCLYARRSGFYRARRQGLGTHFGTAPMSHPAFGALVARQTAQMWRALGEPPIFHLVEVGCGDGALARAVVRASRNEYPEFAQALYYVASDYSTHESQDPGRGMEWPPVTTERQDSHRACAAFERVCANGLRAFDNIVGCIVSNELLDNFPVHRFAVRAGRIQEIYVTWEAGRFVEVLDAPSSPRIEARLVELDLQLIEGQRGEVCLALEDWIIEAARALQRGFVLTIDYGERCGDLYGPRHRDGTLVCYRDHAGLPDPYQHVGEQDITSHVDFTTLMRLGERHGLAASGYALQQDFLRQLGFEDFVKALPAQGLTAARTELSRLAMMTLVDPEEYGDFKVLAQSKGVPADVRLEGFSSRRP